MPSEREESKQEHPKCPGCGVRLTSNANQPWMCSCGYMELDHGCGVDGDCGSKNEKREGEEEG